MVEELGPRLLAGATGWQNCHLQRMAQLPGEGYRFLGENQELGFGYAAAEPPSRHLSVDVEDAVGYGRINSDGEVQARDINLGFITIQMVF